MIEPNDANNIKEILTTASPLITALVDTFVKPKLESFRNKFSNADKKYYVPTEREFTEYYHRTYKKLAVVNTLVFNNSQRFLKDIYLPLTLTSTNDDKIKEKVVSYPHKISEEFGNILITDTAGMGKSTLMKRIFIDAVENNIGIPLIVELRRLSKSKSLISEIQEQLNSLNKSFDSKLLLDLLAEGGFIIILDGYDEISLSDRDVVTADIQDFISKASDNHYFITSRPEKALSSFGNFQEFRINPLNKKEAFELLRKYDHQGEISSLLIKKLQEQEMSNIEEFLTNPLLVSLLFTAFEHKQAIPFKKYLFYRQVYDANFESHDLTKGDSYTHDKYSNLEIDDFHRVMRHLGFQCFKLQKIEFNKDELLNLITKSKNFCVGLDFKESDFLQDLLRTVPLFAQDGNYYRWAHKSLQEYFAAQFIYLDSKEKQNPILEKLSSTENVEKFINVLDLYYDMDYKTFRNVIEYNLLLEYEKYSKENYNKSYSEIKNEDVLKRKELAFLIDTHLFRAEKADKKDPFEGKRLSKMIKDYQDKNGLEDKRFSGVLLSPPFTDNIYAIHYVNPKTSLLLLLMRKKNNIVKSIKRKTDFKKSKVSIDCEIENEFEMIQITDEPNSPFNSEKNFRNINEFIQATRMFPVTIDDKNALTTLNQIKAHLEKESVEDFLIDGI
jgi:hypothetical protein